MRARPPFVALVLISVSFALAATLFAGDARADPWIDFDGARTTEDRYADGDIDAEDLVAPAIASRHSAGGDVHAESWLSLKGFYAEYAGGARGVGALAVVGLALDRIASGSPQPHLEPVRFTEDGGGAIGVASDDAQPPPLITGKLARACVSAAWRASGLGVSDARIDAIVARARTSAALPETRFRIMRVFNESAATQTTLVADGQRYYDTSGANLWLEARFTWRLDRLLYVDDEPTLERVRIERQEARARVAARVLDALFLWQRASVAARAAPAGSIDAQDAFVRLSEAEAALDVLTSGWFSAAREREGAPK